MNDYWTKVLDDAENRIREDISAGKKANLADLLTLGTRFDVIESWFKDSYKDFEK